MIRFALAATAAFFACAPASAATIVREVTISLQTTAGGIFGRGDVVSTPVQAGDTIDLTINFAARLDIQNPVEPGSGFFVFLLEKDPIGGDSALGHAGSAEYTLINPAGDYPPSGSTPTFGFPSIGIRELPLATPGEPTFGSFDGIRLVYTVTGNGSRPFDAVQFQVGLQDFNAVPEPASWALMIAGFGLVGAGFRQRGRGRVENSSAAKEA